MDKLNQDIGSAIMVLFTKSYCPYSLEAMELVNRIAASSDVTFKYLELDNSKNGDHIQQMLYDKTGQQTVPYIFVNGSFVGGNAEFQKQYGRA